MLSAQHLLYRGLAFPTTTKPTSHKSSRPLVRVSVPGIIGVMVVVAVCSHEAEEGKKDQIFVREKSITVS